MNILVIGSGGREHTLAWKIKESERCKKLFVAPGNAGTASIAHNVNIGVTDFEGLAELCLKEQIQMVVVGPEAPLVAGIRDYFAADERLTHISVIGPDQKGAALEGSKDFSKKFMLKHNIPTAQARTFNTKELEQGLTYLESCKMPIVLKADGLAAGKGVIISDNLADAKVSLKEMLEDKKFGPASERVLVEEYLDGIELSVFVLTDGLNYKILPEAKDYKRIGEGDSGPNTGGMGAVSPVSFADEAFMNKVEQHIIKPTIDGLSKEDIDYRGFIFIGLMNVNGDPYVIEYNVRMGDPETQAVLPRIKSDFVALFDATANQTLSEVALAIDDTTSVTVVLASNGYPGSYEKGKAISGIENADDALVFHAGTKLNEEGVVTNGGRVMAVTGQGQSLKGAVEKAYSSAQHISWDGVIYRRDIGQDLLALN